MSKGSIEEPKPIFASTGPDSGTGPHHQEGAVPESGTGPHGQEEEVSTEKGDSESESEAGDSKQPEAVSCN